MDLVNPCGIYQRHDTPLAARKPLADIQVVGLFSNLKHNANLYLDEVAKRLKERYPHLEFVRQEKFASGPATFSHEWLARIHAAVAAFGD